VPSHRYLLPIAALGIALVASPAGAAPDDPATATFVGVALRGGGRFDNVRMCVASPAGTPGGPAADVSLFVDVPVGGAASVLVDLPVMRPILFGAAFRMLQFEPTVGLRFRRDTGGRVGLVAGPTLGLSLHYGPDYRSAPSGSGRGPSFLALGPQVGGFLGLHFPRPEGRFDLQLGVSPYVAALWGVNDPAGHRGVVAGGLLDVLLRLSTGR